MKRNDFNTMLSKADLYDVVREAGLKERALMMTFHMMLIGAMFIMMFIIVQWLVGQHMAMTMSPPINGEHAQARMLAVNISSLFVSAICILSLGLISKTPLTYMIFSAKVVDERTLGDISKSQAALRCAIKTLAIVFTPLAIFYLIRYRNSNVVDSITQTRVIVIEKRLALACEKDSENA